MKRIILVLFFVCGLMQGQEIIGELPGGYSLEVEKVDQRNMYVLMFRNSEYESIIDLKNLIFYGQNEDLENLYQFIMSADDEFKQMNIGDNDIRVKTMRKYIMVTVYPENEVDSYFVLTPKQLKKLFGKA